MGVTACLLRNCLQWPHKRDFLGRSDSEVGSSVIRQMLTAGNFFTINRVVCSLDCQLCLSIYFQHKYSVEDFCIVYVQRQSDYFRTFVFCI